MAQLQDYDLAVRGRLSKDFVAMHSRRTSAACPQSPPPVSDLLDTLDELHEVAEEGSRTSLRTHTPPLLASLPKAFSTIDIDIAINRSQPAADEHHVPLQPTTPGHYLQVGELRRAPPVVESDYIEVDGPGRAVSPEDLPPLLSQPSHLSDAALSCLDLTARLPHGSQVNIGKLDFVGY
jgi:hypothetical protein